MYCSNCGASKKNNENNCSSCGEYFDDEFLPPSSQPIKTPFWFKISTIAILSTILFWGWLFFEQPSIKDSSNNENIYSLISYNETSQPTVPHHDTNQETPTIEPTFVPIKTFLTGLRVQDFKKAYETTSTEFQQASPFEKFINFVKSYPILLNYSEVLIIDQLKPNENKAFLKLVLDPSKGAIPIEFQLTKEGNIWKIWSFQVILPGDKVPQQFQDPNAIMKPIKNFLADLKNHNYEMIYKNDLSKTYQSHHSLRNFIDFINKNTHLNDSQNAILQKMNTEGSMAKLLVEIISNNRTENYVFLIEKEKNEFKISDIEPGDKSFNNENYNPDELLKTINEQLEAIKNQDISKAYYEYTSTDFKSSTSLDNYKIFVNQYPAFANYRKISLPDLKFNNNAAILKGILTTRSGEQYSVEYQLIQEQNKWKILHIEIKPIIQQFNFSHPISFSEALIGKKIDKQGVVTDPQTVIPADKQDLYDNLYILNGAKDTKIIIQLQHAVTGSEVPAITTTLPKNGDSILSFVFSPPKEGWPPGNYILKARSSTGVNQTFSVQMK